MKKKKIDTTKLSTTVYFQAGFSLGLLSDQSLPLIARGVEVVQSFDCIQREVQQIERMSRMANYG